MLLLLAVPEPAVEDEAEPEMSDLRQFTCPVGGGSFTQEVAYYSLPLVTFPDGSWLGDDKIDAQIPLCPDNGLVILPDYDAMKAPGVERMIYGAYSEAELARLPGLIADPAYVALKPDGRHVLALWLATRLGRPALTRFILLQRATWAATDPGLRNRLVARLAEEGPALIDAADLSAQARRVYRYYIVNALRELGRFDEALALIETVERQGGPPVQSPRDPDTTYGTVDYAPLMRSVIAEKDMERFPVRLMTWRWTRMVCSDEDMPPPYGPLSATSRAACARFKAEEARERAEGNALLEEDAALEDEEE